MDGNRDVSADIGVSLRVDLGATTRIGPGKIALLEAVDRTGSISAAGRELGMSYRRAWMLVDALNRAFRTPVVEASTGGARGGGARVTPFGAALVDAYRALERDLDAAARHRLGRVRANLAEDRGAPGGGPGVSS